MLLLSCHQNRGCLSSPSPGLQRNEPGALVPHWLSTPALTLRCQPVVCAVFELRAGCSEWPHHNRPLLPLGWRTETRRAAAYVGFRTDAEDEVHTNGRCRCRHPRWLSRHDVSASRRGRLGRGGEPPRRR